VATRCRALPGFEPACTRRTVASCRTGLPRLSGATPDTEAARNTCQCQGASCTPRLPHRLSELDNLRVSTVVNCRSPLPSAARFSGLPIQHRRRWPRARRRLQSSRGLHQLKTARHAPLSDHQDRHRYIRGSTAGCGASIAGFHPLVLRPALICLQLLGRRAKYRDYGTGRLSLPSWDNEVGCSGQLDKTPAPTEIWGANWWARQQWCDRSPPQRSSSPVPPRRQAPAAASASAVEERCAGLLSTATLRRPIVGHSP
jgi:hypothetical protein